MASRDRIVVVAVKLPWQGRDEADRGHLGEELRLLWIIEQVRKGRVGVGKGAELAEVPRAGFMRLLGEHGVPVIDYPAADLEREARLIAGG